MKFNSGIHGEFKYTEDDIIELVKPIQGFEWIHKFILVELEGYKPFKLFQALEDDRIAFIVTSPFEFFEEYELNISDSVIKDLDIKNSKDVIILTTINLNSDPKKTTTNLRAPIIINKLNRLGEQIILDIQKYKIKHPLLKE